MSETASQTSGPAPSGATFEFRMPSLGADMDAGTLVKWHVQAGEAVKRGSVVADVETDKGIVEVEIWEDGTVDSLMVAPGTKVPVGTILATLRRTGQVPKQAPKTETMAVPQAKEPAPSQSPPAQRTPAERAPAVPSPVLAPVVAERHLMASPAARQLARERGVDLAHVHGTGPHGAITRNDVADASPSGPPMPAAEIVPRPRPAPPVDSASSMRRAIAAAMSRSKREIPHYYLSAEIDAQKALRWLEGENAKRGVAERILFASVLLKATALAAREVPEVNGFFVDGAFRAAEQVHIGVAVSMRQGGLVAPAIHDVDTKSIAEVQGGLRDLVARVRSGRLRSSEMSDPTLTVTNLGDQGVLSVFGVIYPPQVALVGFGRVTERPWAEGGMIGVRPVVAATLAADHRVSDGHRGGLFLSAIARLLQEPEKL